MIKTRLTKINDFEAVYNLLKAGDMLLINFNEDKFSQMLKRNKGSYFVAVDKRKVIGSIFASYDGGNYVYVNKLIVDKVYRNKGIASKLIQEVLNKFNDNKDIWVFCHIKEDNQASIKTFQKMGFKKREEHRLFDNA